MMMRNGGFIDGYDQIYTTLPVYSTVPYVREPNNNTMTSVEKPQPQQKVLTRSAGQSQQSVTQTQTQTPQTPTQRAIFLYPDAKMSRSFPITVKAAATAATPTPTTNMTTRSVVAGGGASSVQKPAASAPAKQAQAAKTVVEKTTKTTTTTKILLKQPELRAKSQSAVSAGAATAAARAPTAGKFKIVASTPQQDVYSEWNAQQNSGYTDGYGTARLGGLATHDRLFVNPKMIYAMTSTRTAGTSSSPTAITDTEKQIEREEKQALNAMLETLDWEGATKRIAGQARANMRQVATMLRRTRTGGVGVIDVESPFRRRTTMPLSRSAGMAVGRVGSKKTTVLPKKKKKHQHSGGQDNGLEPDPLGLERHLRYHRHSKNLDYDDDEEDEYDR
jgi:hypothetical protein